jgi:hypothetical protein
LLTCAENCIELLHPTDRNLLDIDARFWQQVDLVEERSANGLVELPPRLRGEYSSFES